MYAYNYGGQKNVRTPVQFLARHYGFSDAGDDQQIEAIAEKLDSLKAKTDAAELRNIYALCRATDDEYVGVASGLIDAAKGTKRRSDEQKWQAAMATVVEVWKERKLQADVSQFFIDYAVRQPDSRSGTSSRNGIPYRDRVELWSDYVKELVKAKGIGRR